MLPSSSLAISKSDPAVYTVAYVEQAIRYYQAHGREATVEYYQKPESRDGEWYLFLTDEGLNMISIPIPDLMGKHASDIGETLDGVNFADVEYTEEGVWISYEFLNPATGETESNIPGLRFMTAPTSAPAGTSPRPSFRPGQG